MPSRDVHRDAAEQSLKAAQFLANENPEWSLVPLFYSANHLMHAKFIEDGLPADMQCPESHTSSWRGSVRLKWGTLDVVAKRYNKLHPQFSSLFTASLVPRYQGGTLRATDRFWGEYDVIARFVGDR